MSPPGSELNDRWVYRIAVGAIGLALVVVLAGVCVIVALNIEKEIPKELWATASALAGGLLGLLAPQPASSSAKEEDPVEKSPEMTCWEAFKKKSARLWKIFLKDIWANRTVVILLAIFGVSVGFGFAEKSHPLQSLAAASGAALVGLLAPPPGAPEKAGSDGSAE